jgi:DNA-binding beta-propeller fold protein YncE
VAVSPENKELYAVTGDDEWASVFSLEANGDVAPIRRFTTDHGSAGIFLDRKNDELFITGEHLNKLAVFRRAAEGDGQELRFIQGPDTGLADPHGVFADSEGEEVFVTNHGNWRKTESGEKYFSVVLGSHTAATLRPSTGQFLPPSITVYSRTARGNVAPVRAIQGPTTGLNLPLGLYLDSASGQIAVANSGDKSVLFFDKNAKGNAAPVRMIQGPATGLDGPTGIFIDTKRGELWVSNWDNHTATVYARTAEGNAAPLRTMRSAPKGTRYAGFGNIGDVAFDPKRKQILVPN